MARIPVKSDDIVVFDDEESEAPEGKICLRLNRETGQVTAEDPHAVERFGARGLGVIFPLWLSDDGMGRSWYGTDTVRRSPVGQVFTDQGLINLAGSIEDWLLMRAETT